MFYNMNKNTKVENKKNSLGFTLIELLIGITMSSMIFIVATNFAASLFTTDTKGKNEQTVQQVKLDLQAELSQSIRWGQVISFGENVLQIDQVLYRLDNGRLFRGSDPLTPQTVKVTKFVTRDLSNNPNYKSLEVTIAVEYQSTSTINDSFTIVSSQRRTQIDE